MAAATTVTSIVVSAILSLVIALALPAPSSAAVFQNCAETATDTENSFVRRVAAHTDVCACGSTLPDSLFQQTTFAYKGTVSYTPTGSSTGRESVEYNSVDFAGSDSLLTDTQYSNAPDLQAGPAARRGDECVPEAWCNVSRTSRQHVTSCHGNNRSDTLCYYLISRSSSLKRQGAHMASVNQPRPPLLANRTKRLVGMTRTTLFVAPIVN